MQVSSAIFSSEDGPCSTPCANLRRQDRRCVGTWPVAVCEVTGSTIAFGVLCAPSGRITAAVDFLVLSPTTAFMLARLLLFIHADSRRPRPGQPMISPTQRTEDPLFNLTSGARSTSSLALPSS
jgi:hypothetical protein